GCDLFRVRGCDRTAFGVVHLPEFSSKLQHRETEGVNLADQLYAPAHREPQRRAAAVLLCIALIAIVLDVAGLKNSPSASTYLLLAALVVIAIAVHKTEG